MHFAGGHENKEGLLPAIREAELEASVQGTAPMPTAIVLKDKSSFTNVQYQHQNHTNSIYSICTFFLTASMVCTIGPVDPDHALHDISFF